MRIIFTQGYRGKPTGERWYEAGDVAEIEDIAAQQLIAQGVAVSPEPEPEPAHVGRRSRRKEADEDESP